MHFDQVISLVASLLCFLMAILGRRFWWGRLGGFTSRLPAKPAPTWLGRVFFFVGGVWFLIAAFYLGHR